MSNIFLVVGSFIVVSLILWNTNSFFKTFKEEERLKMEIWATAQSEFLQSAEDVDLGSLHLKVFQNNTSTPMILINKDSSIRTNNIPTELAKDSLYISKKLRQFQDENVPISIDQQGEHLATLYYGNSEVLNKLKFYPIALLLIILLFGAVIYFLFKTNKASEQNKLWAGMAKETAHQIGTPLSSLLGWNELLKTENINPDITKEIEKDIAHCRPSRNGSQKLAPFQNWMRAILSLKPGMPMIILKGGVQSLSIFPSIQKWRMPRSY